MDRRDRYFVSFAMSEYSGVCNVECLAKLMAKIKTFISTYIGTSNRYFHLEIFLRSQSKKENEVRPVLKSISNCSV
jgi:hypothetical protein